MIYERILAIILKVKGCGRPVVGILCEKPSAARNFSKALGGMSGTYNGEPYIIVNALGHLYELKKPEFQVPEALVSQYKSWDLAKLPWSEVDFAWKREKKDGINDVLKELKAKLGAVDEICIATDVDPSGEGYLLGAEVIQELKLKSKPLSRMYFTDESPKEIQKAFANRKRVPKLEDDKEYLMAWYRTRWDFLSMQFTRVATKLGDGRSVLRQGRLKSAMVLIVGDQLKLLAGYKKIPFYQNRFRDENGVVYTNPEEPVFPAKDQVPQSYKASDVICDSKTMKASAPPKFMDLAGLSARLASKGHKSKDVLATYQKMYEAQIVSYPRTEDKVVTPEQFNELLPLADKIARVVGVDPAILTHRKPRPTHVKTGGAHGANRPGPNVPNKLSDLTQYGACAVDIYVLLAKSYLACMAEDYKYEAQKGHVKDYPKFVGSASVPKSVGWKAVFGDSLDDDADPDENKLGLGTFAKPFVHEGFPPKPATPTMKWLMTQLEKRDVGTGATRTSTYADVTNEKAKFPLLTDKRGKIGMTDYGQMSYGLLPNTHIGDLGITERVQAQARDIAAGKLNPDQCLHEMQQMVRDDIKTMMANSQTMRKELGVKMADFVQKEKFSGVWKGSPVAFNRTFRQVRVDDETCEKLCAGETVVVENIPSKGGGTYAAQVKLAHLEYNGRKYVGMDFVGFVNSNAGGLPDGWCGHTFTPAEKQSLEAGGVIKITDAVSKKTGRKFACKMSYDKATGLKPDFNVVPNSWGGHTFTEDEILMLESGQEVQLDGLVSKKTGKEYSCKVVFGDKEDGSGKAIIPKF